MNYKKILLSILCFAFTLNAQIPNIKKISVQDSTRNIVASSVVSGVGNNLFFFWADSNLLYSAYTSDYGETWSIPTVIADDVKSIRSEPEIRTLKLASGRILLIYKATRHFLIYSDDSGLSWSSKIELPTSTSIQSQYVATPHLTQFDDGRIVFAYSLLFPSGSYRNQAYLIESLDGTIWTERDTIVSSTKRVGAPTLVSINSEKLLLAYQEMDAANKFEIRLKNSNDSGKTWSGGDIIVTDKYKVKQPQLIKDDAGTIWLFYLSLNSLPFESYWKSGFLQSDINFIKSSDAGNSWTSPEKFTEHLLDDEKFLVSLIDGKLFITFSSVRPNEYLAKSLDPHFGFAVNEHPYQVYFGIGGESSDDQTPPVIFEGELEFTGNYPIIDITAKVKIPDDNIKTAAFNFKLNDGIEETILLNDAGIEGDLIATDYTYSEKLSASGFQYIDFYFSVENESGIKSKTETMRSIGTPDVLAKSYLVNVNKFQLPLWYNGTLADAEITFPDGTTKAGAHFDDISFLFSGGFYMSGKNGDELWSANEFSTSRLVDFVNGKVGTQLNNYYSRIFALKSSDPPFSVSWKNWGFAVSQGADFYDGDNDGLYSPIDKNKNGLWDLDEDKPMFLGDESAWCVFNDGIPQENRRFNNNPMGIEIQQTVFGYSPETYKELENVLF
ncbi:MAG: sialidase family protein, partial [Bacteroidota bacterium]